MLGMLAAPLAEFFQLQPVLESFFILIRIVIGALAHGAFEFDEVVLGHNYVRNYEIYEITK